MINNSFQEEWILLFNYVLAFPTLIGQTIGEFHKSTFSLHNLCIFLSGLASTFSIYYARIRILTVCYHFHKKKLNKKILNWKIEPEKKLIQ